MGQRAPTTFSAAVGRRSPRQTGRERAPFRAGPRARGETPEVLDGLSEVAHFEGEYDRAIELKERAFAAYRRAGKRVEAADIARWLAFLHGTFHGNFSVASGWMGRARASCKESRSAPRTAG